MDDPYDTRYIASIGKAILVDLILIFLFTTIYTVYHLIFEGIITIPIHIIKSQIFLMNNFILLLILITYFIYKSRQII